ncbi:diacylglycerol O-acyltransferase [Citrus sinensis]|uniref:Diacylglycerol O-acyltransferase n=1 Tax=Citrus sinensis TaxID=2711 RepID=A0ACB8N2X0_CITSI|nr:diacylglycerol O-acyltransferase [Citrus sinensis]
MELKEAEETEPVSPSGQYLNSSALSLSVLGVLESEIPIDDSQCFSLLKDIFLPINPRFSSIMVVDENGEKRWKRVEVKLRNHVKVPIFPSGLSPEAYDKYFDDYISEIGMELFPQSQPLWEVHIIKYPTSHAAGFLIFKLHHSLGDGFSLMGALLSCLQRADDPSVPLTFPSVNRFPSNKKDGNNSNIFSNMYKTFCVVSETVSDFCWSFVKSAWLQDDRTPIYSGDDGIEFRPVSVATTAFSLDQIKQIKTKVDATVNDVIAGIIFLGTRLYMQEMRQRSGEANSTTLVLLNTRAFRSYESVKDMVKPDAKSPWGNYFAFLHVSIPKLADDWSSNPLDFVVKARQIMNVKKNSLGAYLTGRLLEIVRKFRGPEAAARYIRSTLKNSSMTITNVIGPVEKMALNNHPCKGLYFVVTGAPQSLSVTIVSYMGKLRIAVVGEDGFIDSHKLKSSIENAFEMMLNGTS